MKQTHRSCANNYCRILNLKNKIFIQTINLKENKNKPEQILKKKKRIFTKKPAKRKKNLIKGKLNEILNLSAKRKELDKPKENLNKTTLENGLKDLGDKKCQ